jgi:dephospho-CoA kinase
MPGVTRRTLLAFTAVASVVEPTFAEGEGASRELQALIATHETAYAALHRVVHRADGSWHDRKRADRIEEQALLAICSYPAISRGDRRAKADYLLTVEARGELDLEVHMQAILHSTMWG